MNLQRIADWYSENGQFTIQVCVYRAEALIYLQVSRKTFSRYLRRISRLTQVSANYVEGSVSTTSADGLTHVIYLRRFAFAKADWLTAVMSDLSTILPELVYNDNRHVDQNTVESFARLINA